ncbi:MAG: staygreen family protein [Clostridium sp.]|nr:staygreen family protein [Clostridium sp.]
MSKFIPEKLFVDFKDNVEINTENKDRKYTLTHSDETADLFLTIGRKYDYEKTNETRDEVLAEWKVIDGKTILSIYLQVSLDQSLTKTIIRDKVFREELPLALNAIIYGDKAFINKNQELYKATVVVNFKSDIPKYNKTEEWGMVIDYLYDESRCSKHVPKLYIRDDKNDTIEEALIRILSLYIKIQINIFAGREASYCLDDAEVLYSKRIGKEEYLPDEFEVGIGLKIGNPTPKYNNFIIIFLIKDNVINVKDSKMINM